MYKNECVICGSPWTTESLPEYINQKDTSKPGLYPIKKLYRLVNPHYSDARIEVFRDGSIEVFGEEGTLDVSKVSKLNTQAILEALTDIKLIKDHLGL